jgi:hypothetical protein
VGESPGVAALRVGDLVRGDLVDEGGEGGAGVGVAGKHVDDGEADLLGHVLGHLGATAVGAQPGAGVAVHGDPDSGDQEVERDGVTVLRTSDEVGV